MTFTLEQADSTEFARWWAVYRHANEDFSQGYEEQIQEIQEVPFCHWIMLDGQRVGGMIYVEQDVGDFFLVPPFTDAYSALKAVLPPEGNLRAQGILPQHVPVFQMLGFQVEESRVWMVRPTQPYDVTLPYRRVAPAPTHTDVIAQLMYNAFKNGVGEYGQRDVPEHRASVEDYFETVQTGDICHQASSVLLNGDEMVAVCLVQPYKSLASIRFVVTHPGYQRQGIAQQVIRYGIQTVHEVYNYILVSVTVGNPAQDLYYQMGFLPGTAAHMLKRVMP